MRAYVYCRVSTQEQARDDHYSLANQETRARDYIKHKSWRCVKVLREVGSGKSAERESYRELLRAIRNHLVDVVVVYRLDRLSRNVVDVYNALDLFRQQEVAFVSVQESFDTTTAMGRAMLGVAAVFAQLTREMIAENVKDGLLRRAQSGKYTGSSHARPYGYEYSGGALQVREEEAQVLRRIFRLYTEQGWGLHRIAVLLNAEGIPTAQGLQGRWGSNTVLRMLHNPLYAGRVRHCGLEYPGEHEPIISAELFSAAQELSRQRARMAPRAKSSPYLLSGLLKCGQCGRALIIHQTPGRTGKPPFLSYRHPSLARLPRCPSFQRGAERIDALVIEEVRKVAASPQRRQAALTQARQELKARGKPLGHERDELLSKLAEGDRTFDRWAERLTREAIDEEQFERLNRAHLEEKRQLRKRLEAIEAELESAGDVELTIGEVERSLEQFGGMWESLTADERRELVRSLVESLTITPEGLSVKLVFMPEVRIAMEPRSRRTIHSSSVA